MEPAESIQNMGLHQESPQFLKPKVGWCRIKEFDKNPKGFFLGQGSPSARKRLSQNIPAWFLDFSYSSPFSSLFLGHLSVQTDVMRLLHPYQLPVLPDLFSKTFWCLGKPRLPWKKVSFSRKNEILRYFHFGISMRKETKTGIKGSFKGSPQFLSSSKAFSATPMKFYSESMLDC